MKAHCKHGAPWFRGDCPLCGRDLEAERLAAEEFALAMEAYWAMWRREPRPHPTLTLSFPLEAP